MLTLWSLFWKWLNTLPQSPFREIRGSSIHSIGTAKCPHSCHACLLQDSILPSCCQNTIVSLFTLRITTNFICIHIFALRIRIISSFGDQMVVQIAFSQARFALAQLDKHFSFMGSELHWKWSEEDLSCGQDLINWERSDQLEMIWRIEEDLNSGSMNHQSCRMRLVLDLCIQQAKELLIAFVLDNCCPWQPYFTKVLNRDEKIERHLTPSMHRA